MKLNSKVYVLRKINGLGICSLYFIKINKQTIICVNSTIKIPCGGTKRNEVYKQCLTIGVLRLWMN